MMTEINNMNIDKKELSQTNNVKNVSKQIKYSSILLRWLYHPVFSFLSLLVGLAGLFLFLSGPPKRKLIFSLNPIKTTVVKAGQTSLLDVYFNKERLSSNVTAIQAAIWNSGKQPIEKYDILEPVTIYSVPPTQFLEAVINKTTRNVTGLNISTDQLKGGMIPISWDILEKDDGAVIQILYVGGTEIKFKIKGILKGQNKIPLFSAQSSISNPVKESRWMRIIFFISGISYLLLPIYAAYVNRHHPRPKRFIFSKVFYLILILLGITLMLISLIYLPHKFVEPPFEY